MPGVKLYSCMSRSAVFKKRLSCISAKRIYIKKKKRRLLILNEELSKDERLDADSV